MSISMPTSNSMIRKFQTASRNLFKTTYVARCFQASIIGVTLLSLLSCGWNETSKAPNLTSNPIVRSAVNGTYAAHSANGGIYRLDLDFENNLYQWRGIAADKQPSSGSIIENKSSGTFNLVANDPKNNTNQILYINNLLIGDFDFGSGPLPFLAIRTIEDLPELFAILHTGHDVSNLSERLTELNTIGSD